ncbi:MAG: TIM barrel protein [Armatimonadota bacterium]|jgi:sugar phosphate isomerase/epimerase
MRDVKDEIYIGTILLEPNRWSRPKTPTYRVSEWLDRFREAGFDGMELWEYHATLCQPEELAALEASSFAASIFNTYCDFDDASEADRRRAAEMTNRLGAAGVKFNVGRAPELRDAYLRNLRAWAELLPDDCRLLCECHGGTIIEEPAAAASFFEEVGDSRVEIIVHCFAAELDRLREWLRTFGSKVTHSHVQLRDDDGNAVRVDRDPAHVKEALHIMREEGYTGSFTLEFTEGTRAPDENMDDLWQAALADLHFLRESL